MKYLFAILSIFVFLYSCEKNEENKMHLTGTVKGLKKGTLILQKIEDTLLISVDSITVNGDSNFSFSEEIISPEVYYLYVRLKDGTLIDERIPFFAENGEINITTKLDKFATEAKITGSKNQDKVAEYQKIMGRYSSKNLEFVEEQFKARQQENDSLAKDLQTKIERLRSVRYLTTVNFALNNKDMEVSPYLMLTDVYDANVKYLDTVYKGLTPKIKDSKYGTQLESYIANRKKAEQ